MDWLILVAGLTAVIVGATWLTNGSVAIAKRLRMSEYLIGMTIVAIGTSLPELTVSTASTLAGKADIAIGNLVGSNTFNTLMILGVCAMLRPIGFTRSNVRLDIPLCLGVSLLLAAMLWNVELSRIEGIVLLAGYVAVLLFSFKVGKAEGGAESEEHSEASFSWWRSVALVVLGLCGLVFGGDFTLDAAVSIAERYGVPESVIAITILAGGTSLPELAASSVALIKGHGAMALGNVIGSNIANILLILGTCSTIAPLTMSGVTMVDVWVMVAAIAVLLFATLLLRARRISRVLALLLLVGYGLYMWYLLKA